MAFHTYIDGRNQGRRNSSSSQEMGLRVAALLGNMYTIEFLWRELCLSKPSPEKLSQGSATRKKKINHSQGILSVSPNLNRSYTIYNYVYI